MGAAAGGRILIDTFRVRTVITTRLYRSGRLQASDFDPALVSDYLEDAENLVCLDLSLPTPEELGMLQEEFYLHPLAIEDASHPHQRPKLERYSTHLFAVIYAAQLQGGHELVACEVNVFLGEQFIITVRKNPSWPIEPVVERWDSGGPLTKGGVGFFLYGLMDVIVDGYLKVSEVLSEALEDIEDEVLEPTSQADLHASLIDLRRSLATFKRIAYPLKDAMDQLERQDLVTLPEVIAPYFVDVRDHLMRVMDSIEGMHGLLATDISLYLTASSNRLNDIMKKITSWAAILGAATTIAGIYGMNFRLYPPSEHPHSFWVALAMIGVTATCLYLYFRRKDWL
jgi:magnesium transporter